jgi:catechol-2,3-dioxygenase
MATDNSPQLSGLYGAYLQVGDLHRSLSFYRDVLALDVVWNDGTLAILHGHRAPPPTRW